MRAMEMALRELRLSGGVRGGGTGPRRVGAPTGLRGATAMLFMVTESTGGGVKQVMGELGLNDNQGAAVTLSYTAVYSLGLLPVGWLADKMPRPPLLALSISMWSAATLCTAYAPSFWCVLVPLASLSLVHGSASSQACEGSARVDDAPCL